MHYVKRAAPEPEAPEPDDVVPEEAVPEEPVTRVHQEFTAAPRRIRFLDRSFCEGMK
jgi:hypothetical protein